MRQRIIWIVMGINSLEELPIVEEIERQQESQLFTERIENENQ